MRGLLARIAGFVRYSRRRQVSRQAGFALVVVSATVAMLGAVVGEFAYNAHMELEAANAARDQLRAEYLARSGINLSRLLIKVQQVVLDRNRQFIGDMQIADFAPYLMSAFGGSTEEREGLSAMLGISASSIKGLGVSKDGSFTVEMGSEDGKINVNCGGGLNPGFNPANPMSPQPQAKGATGVQAPSGSLAPPLTNPQQGLYAMLMALFFPPRYNRIFDNPDAEGQYATRDEVARAIIDWSDLDELRYEPMGASSGAEDYRYDAKRDPYKAHNNYLDTIDEVQLVRGVGDDFWRAFGEMFTVYGGCKVNLNAIRPEHWPISSAIIRAAAKNQQDPLLLDDLAVAALSQQISSMAQLTGGLRKVDDFTAMAQNGGMPPSLAGLMQNPAMAMLLGTQPQALQQSQTQSPGLTGIALDPARIQQLVTVGPRTVYRLDSTGTISRPGDRKVQIHIRAVFDSLRFNQNTTSGDFNDRQGTWVYWRME